MPDAYALCHPSFQQQRVRVTFSQLTVWGFLGSDLTPSADDTDVTVRITSF
jgi:hypothetical protein